MRNNENHIFVDTNCIITYLADKYGLFANVDPLNTSYVMTKNTKDFSALANIVAFAPNKVRKIIF